MEYTVTAGDTLQSIANRYSMSVQRLMEINNLRTDNDLRVGQRIILECGSPANHCGQNTTTPGIYCEGCANGMPIGNTQQPIQQTGNICGQAPTRPNMYCEGCTNGVPIGNTRQTTPRATNNDPMTLEQIDPDFSYPPNNGTVTDPGQQPGWLERPGEILPPGRPTWPNTPPGVNVIFPNPPQGGTVVYPPNYWGQVQIIEPQLQGLNYAWEEDGDFRYILSTNKYRYREGEKVNITFRKRNISDKTVVLRYPSGQLFDFYISDQRGNELWRWSKTRNFSNIMREIVLSPRQAETINITWDQKTNCGYWIPAQTLTLWGVNTATNVSIPLQIVIY